MNKESTVSQLNFSARSLIFAVLVVSFLAPLAASATSADPLEVTAEEFQAAMLTHIQMTGSPALWTRFLDLTEEEWSTIYDWFEDKRGFAEAVELSAARNEDLSRAFEEDVSAEESLRIVHAAAAQLFAPAYPSGGNYSAFTATMPGLGLLIDSPDIGTETGTALNDERCDTNGEGGALIALAALKVTAEIGNTACASTPSPFEPAVCIPAGVLNEAVIADEIVLDQCGYQTALVDSAEIEAAFENSVAIIGTVNGIDAVTSNEANFTDDAELFLHETNIANQITAHDLNISNQLTTHDVKISNQIATHDAEIKVLLSDLQGAVDENQRLIKVFMSRQLEVLRLLITPNGQREISADVLTCTGDDCPVLSPTLICSNGSLKWNCK